ncbi:unnamed protein product [Closterium sp. Naga37s-1]|nr:unnamed protein product [Closterium sp. Naga37s-1]
MVVVVAARATQQGLFQAISFTSFLSHSCLKRGRPCAFLSRLHSASPALPSPSILRVSPLTLPANGLRSPLIPAPSPQIADADSKNHHGAASKSALLTSAPLFLLPSQQQQASRGVAARAASKSSRIIKDASKKKGGKVGLGGTAQEAKQQRKGGRGHGGSAFGVNEFTGNGGLLEAEPSDLGDLGLSKDVDAAWLISGSRDNIEDDVPDSPFLDAVVKVKLKRRGDDTKFVARVLAIGVECDIALLAVDDESFWQGRQPLRFGGLPHLEDAVTVVGYPVGGDSISVTSGVVSRIEVTAYAHGASELLGVQIDAAINPGNSGGPAFNDRGECVGIAFQSLKDSDTENIGYIIPTPVISHFLGDYRRNGQYTGFPAIGILWQRLENPALRAALKMSPGQKGVLVRKVDPTSRAHGVLQQGDVIMSFDNVPIASDGTVPFRTGERISYGFLVSQKFSGEVARLEILRDGQLTKVQVQLKPPKRLIPVHTGGKPPTYLIVAGLVFTPAVQPFLQSEYGSEFEFESPVSLLQKLLHGHAEHQDEEVVVLSQVLAHEANIGYEDITNTCLVSLNGMRVRNVRQLAALVDACTADWESQPFMQFELEHRQLVVLETRSVRAATGDAMADHSIPSDRSEDLRSAAAAEAAAQEAAAAAPAETLAVTAPAAGEMDVGGESASLSSSGEDETPGKAVRMRSDAVDRRCALDALTPPHESSPGKIPHDPLAPQTRKPHLSLNVPSPSSIARTPSPSCPPQAPSTCTTAAASPAQSLYSPGPASAPAGPPHLPPSASLLRRASAPTLPEPQPDVAVVSRTCAARVSDSCKKQADGTMRQEQQKQQQQKEQQREQQKEQRKEQRRGSADHNHPARDAQPQQPLTFGTDEQWERILATRRETRRRASNRISMDSIEVRGTIGGSATTAAMAEKRTAPPPRGALQRSGGSCDVWRLVPSMDARECDSPPAGTRARADRDDARKGCAGSTGSAAGKRTARLGKSGGSCDMARVVQMLEDEMDREEHDARKGCSAATGVAAGKRMERRWGVPGRATLAGSGGSCDMARLVQMLEDEMDREERDLEERDARNNIIAAPHGGWVWRTNQFRRRLNWFFPGHVAEIEWRLVGVRISTPVTVLPVSGEELQCAEPQEAQREQCQSGRALGRSERPLSQH